MSSDESRTARPVFISYATADRKEALSVCKAIERRGTQCWISTRDVEPGENYQEAIVRAIREARAMVLVFSEAANNSDEIKKELSLASRYRVPVMALRIEDVEPSDAFAYELSTRQWIDAFHGWDKSLDALTQRLEQVGGAPQLAATAAPASQGKRARPVSQRWAAVAIGALIVVAAAITLFLWNPFARVKPLTVQIAGFQALAGVPADAPASFQQELRAAFGDDNAVQVRDKDATFTLAGSIRSLGDKVQYAVQLTDTQTGEMVWSATTTASDAAGPLAPQQVANLVVTVVRCGLADAMRYPGTLPTRALSLYLQHCRMTAWGDDGGPERGLDTMQQVVELAPDFSKGWSQLALDSRWASDNTPPDKKTKLLAGAKGAADRALKLDPRNGEAYLALAALLPTSAWSDGEKLYRKSVEVRESDCGCEHALFGDFLLDLGRPVEAVAQYSRAIDQQPNSLDAQRGLASAYYSAGDIPNGDRVLDQMTRFWKGFDGFDRTQLRMATLAGRWDVAAGLAKSIFSKPGEEPIVQGFAAVASRNPAQMAAARPAIAQMPWDRHTAGYRAILLAQLGAHADALAILKPLYADGQGDVALLLDPRLAPLRAEPGWVAILRGLGLVDYWRTSRKPPDFCRAANPSPICRMI